MRRIKRWAAFAAAVVLGVTSICACGGRTENEQETDNAKKEAGGDYKIAVVAGQANNPWYVRTDDGVKKFAQDTGYDAFQKCPNSADAAAQVQVVQDVISQDIDALVIIPISPEALEPVLKQARDQGIVVVAHEGAVLNNIDYDLEAFTPQAYGSFIMDKLAEQTGGTGKYVCMVSFLTASSHNEWADAAIERQKEQYPDMELIPEEKLESEENQEVAYNRTKEILKKYPDLKGIVGTTSFDPPGAQKAINELGLTGKTFTCGTSTTSCARKYIEDGSMSCFTLWDPALSVYASCNLCVKILEGETIENGIDLGIEGYTNMQFDSTGKILQGDGWVAVDAKNMDDYDF